MEKAAFHISQYSAKQTPKKGTEDLMENSFHATNECLVPYNLAKRDIDTQQLKCLSKRKTSSIPVSTRSTQNWSVLYAVIKKCIQNITIIIIENGISQ